LSTRLYLEEPLSADELLELQLRLGRPILAWTRTREQAFAAAGLSDSSSEDAVRAAMVCAPILMERPIVVDAGRAVVGRPPTRVLELLGD
jgi:arsenate reductase